ncbi:hypothetical protein M885DRAFT_525601 [Pelagophyceae sp. CCMP2097]|nr:hypothetical protein M885DRAFT_525601 [Pelagophyceae sp. CCMP2097]
MRPSSASRRKEWLAESGAHAQPPADVPLSPTSAAPTPLPAPTPPAAAPARAALAKANSQSKLSESDQQLVERYLQRCRARPGVRPGGRGAVSDEEKRDYGFGAPKWSPYYRAEGPAPGAPARARRSLGDQAWFKQFGFKGAVSAAKQRDYGNGVPKWSPYHHGGGGDEPFERCALPADAFWFKQFGFKTAELSEAQRRDYGYGVPIWSHYYHGKQ